MLRLVRLSLIVSILALIAGCNLNTSTNTALISGAPIVRIISPLEGTTYLEGVSVNVGAQITNAGADIDRVEIAIDETLATSISDPNPDADAAFAITHSWQTAGIGDHRVAVTAFRGDGSASETALVTITVIADDGSGASQPTQATQSTRFVLPTLTPSTAPVGDSATAAPPTQPPAPTAEPQVQAQTVPTSAGSGAPSASFTQGINVRGGPGLEFDPPIGAYAAGQSAEILAISTGGDWYKVRFGGGQGWVYGPLVTVTGNTAALPREAGPPRPTARPATAVQVVATQPSQSGANLVTGIVVLNPDSPVCGQTFTVGLDVANLGTAATTISGTVTLVDVRAADGSTQAQTVGGFPVIQPGQTVRVDMPLTVTTWYNETHRITLTIDQANQIPESNRNDNAVSIDYTLNKGDCP